MGICCTIKQWGETLFVIKQRNWDSRWVGRLPLQQPGRFWLGCGPRSLQRSWSLGAASIHSLAPPLPAACLGSGPSSLCALASQPAARAGLDQLCPISAHPRAFALRFSLPGGCFPHLDLPGKAPSPPSGHSSDASSS